MVSMPGLEAIPLSFLFLQSQTLPHPSVPSPRTQEEADILSHLCVCAPARVCLPWALLPAGGHGPSGAGSAGSLLRGRLRPAACTCLSGALGVETTGCSLVRYVGLQPPHSFRSLLIPFSQAHPSLLPPSSVPHLGIKAPARPLCISPLMLASTLWLFPPNSFRPSGEVLFGKEGGREGA